MAHVVHGYSGQLCYRTAVITVRQPQPSGMPPFVIKRCGKTFIVDEPAGHNGTFSACWVGRVLLFLPARSRLQRRSKLEEGEGQGMSRKTTTTALWVTCVGRQHLELPSALLS